MYKARQGMMYVTSTKQKYTFFSITNGASYSRFDIAEEGAIFQHEPHKVLFSVITKKDKIYIYGDRQLNQIYKDTKSTVIAAKLPTTQKTELVGPIYIRTSEKGVESERPYYRNVQERGRLKEEIFATKDCYIADIDAKDSIQATEQLPYNFSEYVEVDMSDLSEVGSKIKSDIPTLAELKLQYDLKHIDERDYEVIDEEGTKELIEEILNIRDVRLIGVDYETTGLDMNNSKEDEIVGIVISTDWHRSRYVPFKHNLFENVPFKYHAELIKSLNTYSDWLETVTYQQLYPYIYNINGEVVFGGIGGQNIKFEYKCLMAEEEVLNIHHDSLQLSFAANPRIGRGIHGLKTLTERAEGNEYIEFTDTLGKNSETTFADVPKDVVKYYACPDPDSVRTVLYDIYNNHMPYKESMFIYRLETELAEVKASQEYWGFRIDVDRYTKDYQVVLETQEMLERLIRSMAKWPDLKLTSEDSLAELLYNRMRCPVLKVTKEGKWSTDSSVLDQLSRMELDEPRGIVTEDVTDSTGKPIIKASKLDKARYPITLLLSEHRKYVKLSTAFFSRIEKQAKGSIHRKEGSNEVEYDKGKSYTYYFWINANGTLTGRQSSPAHQFPKIIKAEIITDSEEHGMIGTDYSQIELRIVYSQAGEEDFIELCKDPGNDIHRIILSKIKGMDMWEISASDRSKGKRANFGFVYDISGMGLARQIHGPKVTKEQIKESQKALDDILDAYPKLKLMKSQIEKVVRRRGYMKTQFGRFRYFDILYDESASKSKIKSAIRQAGNLPVQGSAADIMKMAEVEMHKKIKEKGWDKLVDTPQGKKPICRVMFSAHDEMLVSYHKPTVPLEEILKMKRDAMEITVEGWAPLFGSSSVIENWLEGKKDEYAIPIELRDKLIEDYERTGVSAMKSYNHRDEMSVIIQHHLDEELNSYMQGLVAENGTNPEKVAKAVKHPTLTHSLIARFPQSKEHKQEFGELSHVDSIKYAVEQYLKGESSNTQHQEDEGDTDFDMTAAEIDSLSEALFDVDDKGNFIYLDSQELPDEYADYDEEEEATTLESTKKGQLLQVWKFLDSYVVMLNGLTPPMIDKVLERLNEYWDPKGMFTIKVMYQEKLVDTNITCKGLPVDDINEFIHELKKGALDVKARV